MKGKLRLSQEAHATRIATLLLYAAHLGIGVAKGDGFRDPRVHGEMGIKLAYGHKNSCHKLKLADDLNIDHDQDHILLHNEWDRLGGAARLLHDMNHYSSGWETFI